MEGEECVASALIWGGWPGQDRGKGGDRGIVSGCLQEACFCETGQASLQLTGQGWRGPDGKWSGAPTCLELASRGPDQVHGGQTQPLAHLSRAAWLTGGLSGMPSKGLWGARWARCWGVPALGKAYAHPDKNWGAGVSGVLWEHPGRAAQAEEGSGGEGDLSRSGVAKSCASVAILVKIPDTDNAHTLGST